MPVDKQGTNVTVGTVARINPIDKQAICTVCVANEGDLCEVDSGDRWTTVS